MAIFFLTSTTEKRNCCYWCRCSFNYYYYYNYCHHCCWSKYRAYWSSRNYFECATTTTKSSKFAANYKFQHILCLSNCFFMHTIFALPDDASFKLNARIWLNGQSWEKESDWAEMEVATAHRASRQVEQIHSPNLTLPYLDWLSQISGSFSISGLLSRNAQLRSSLRSSSGIYFSAFQCQFGRKK